MKGVVSLVVALTGAMCGELVAESRHVETAETSRDVDWKATFQQTGGNVQLCQSGHRGRIEIRGTSLAAFTASSHPARPVFKISLAADSSADVEIGIFYGLEKKAHVKVVPGSGPRSIQFVTLTNVCYYNVVPD
jgi:hypothetical protein